MGATTQHKDSMAPLSTPPLIWGASWKLFAIHF